MSEQRRVVQTTHEMPMPMRAEADIVAAIEQVTRSFVEDGGVVVSVRRHRNEVFDRKGERTSTTFVVDWPNGHAR